MTKRRCSPNGEREVFYMGTPYPLLISPRAGSAVVMRGQELPLGPALVAAEAVQIISVFDATRIAAFGSSTEPRYPAPTDRIDAARWLAAGPPRRPRDPALDAALDLPLPRPPKRGVTPGGFVIEAATWAEFAEAMRRKLTLEVAGR